MLMCTDGTKFKGLPKSSQTWVKGRTTRKITSLNNHYVEYQSKKDMKDGTCTKVALETFAKWLFSGARLKVSPRFATCSICENRLEITEHVNKCSCGNRIKILS